MHTGAGEAGTPDLAAWSSIAWTVDDVAAEGGDPPREQNPDTRTPRHRDTRTQRHKDTQNSTPGIIERHKDTVGSS